MRILVTGARDWPDSDDHALPVALAKAWKFTPHEAGIVPVLVHGACPTGADMLAAQWACTWAWTVEAHPADWETHGKAAGFRRNAEMVALGADVCVAFVRPCTSPRCAGKPSHDSHGTAHCAGLARKAGIPVVEVRG